MNDFATKQDVQAIVSKAVDDLSGVIASLAQSMHGELLDVRGDIAELKDDVTGLKTDVAELKTDVAELKTDVAELKTDVRELQVTTFKLESKVDELILDNARIHKSIDRLTNTLDSFVGRLDRYETEQAARDSQFDKLLEWARKVSKKTGIPLEDL